MTIYRYSNSSQTTQKVQRSADAGADTGAQNPTPESEQEIDLQALADKLYSLIRQELQLERERLGNKGS